MTATADTIQRPRGLPASYVAMWLLLLTLSIAYLAGVALHPDLMAQILPAPIGDPESNEGQRSSARAVADADELRQSLERTRAELAEARSELSAKAAPPVPAAAEPAPPPAQPKPAARAAEKAKSAKQAAAAVIESRPTAATALTAGAPAAEPAPAPQAYMQPGRIINGQPAEGATITTGSLATPGTAAAAAAIPAFGPATVKPARPEPTGPHGVQLASGPSLDALRLSWVLLTERHGAALKGLEPRYVAGSDESGQTYNLIAGPLPNAEDAARVCSGLKAKKVACAVSPYAGNAL